MSLLILGADFPKKCDDCPCCEELISGYCDIDVTYECSALYFPYHPEKSDVTKIRETGRLPYCPVVDVPTPHGRLIDADKLIEFITNGLNRKENPMGFDAIEILTEIEYSKTIIEAEGE